LYATSNNRTGQVSTLSTLTRALRAPLTTSLVVALVAAVESSDDSGEVGCDRVEAEIVNSPLGDDHDVNGSFEELWLRAVRLSDPPLDAVSMDGVADLS